MASSRNARLAGLDLGDEFASLFSGTGFGDAQFAVAAASSKDTVATASVAVSDDTMAPGEAGAAAALTPQPGIGTYNGQVGSAANAYLISAARQAYVAKPSALYNLGSMFSVSSVGATAPAYISVSLYDRDAYAGKESYNYGTLTATNGATYKAGGFTLNFALVNGQYVTANGETLSDFTFAASTQENRVENFSMYAYDAKGTVLTSRNVEVVTHATTVDKTPGLATAAEIASVAQSMIGQVWDASGCWNLACDISATAGAALPINSGWISPSVGVNGQWTEAYNAYTGVKANWMSTLQAGDMVELGWTGANYGHIFTIDRVVNGTAYLVDNSGAYLNKAGGDPTDLYVVERKITDYTPYINQSTVVVFRDSGTASSAANIAPTTLFTPITDLGVGKSVALSTLFRSTDADNDAITQYMVRDDGSNGGYISLNGAKQAVGQWTTITAAQLSQLTYTASSSGSSSEAIEVKAFDGKTWGVADTGRIVSLYDQTNQNDEKTFRNFGAVDKASYATKATEWVGSTDKYDWFTFSVAGPSASVDVQLSNMTGQVDLWVYNTNTGALVGSAYGYQYNNLACKLTGTLSTGSYTIRIDDYLGDTNYDLTVGKTGTLPTVASGGTTQAIYSGEALKPTQGAVGDSTNYFAGVSPLAGTAPSLALADSTGLGSGSANVSVVQPPANQNDRLLLAQA